MNPPLIGITCNYLEPLPSAFKAGIGAEEQAWQLIAQDYLEAVWRAGGIPLLLPVDQNKKRALAMLDMTDGIILSGGNDIAPQSYGEVIEDACNTPDPDRDEMEILMCKKALEADKPILGICRGMQILNVALGGTLHQDLETDGFLPHSKFSQRRNLPAHPVTVTKASLLEQITGESQLLVNSFHHQAVKELGEGLQAAAVSEDGVVEAVTMAGKRFVLALQWHPEMMHDSGEQQSILNAFIKAGAQANKKINETAKTRIRREFHV